MTPWQDIEEAQQRSTMIRAMLFSWLDYVRPFIFSVCASHQSKLPAFLSTENAASKRVRV